MIFRLPLGEIARGIFCERAGVADLENNKSPSYES